MTLPVKALGVIGDLVAQVSQRGSLRRHGRLIYHVHVSQLTPNYQTLGTPRSIMYGEYTTLGSMVPLLTVVLVLVYVFTVPGRRGNTLPPGMSLYYDYHLSPPGLLTNLAATGPPTVPVLGNLHQLPREKAFLKFAEWAKLYGEIYSLKIASNTMVVISSRRIVKELMDKRSSISSHRPPLYAVNDLVYKGHFLLLMNADHARFRQQRKIIHQFYMESVCEKNHMSYITAESAQLMVDLLKAPHEFHEHAKRYTNSLIMSTGMKFHF